MSVRPIIFSAPMVRALLAGTKTQTRRVLKRHALHKPEPHSIQFHDGKLICRWQSGIRHDVSSPYAPGDLLWVREGFMPAPIETPPDDPRPTRWSIAYAAGGQAEVMAAAGYNPMLYNYERWSPSIHMPRWASRLTLRVTDVRVQRVQDITLGDCWDEGCKTGRDLIGAHAIPKGSELPFKEFRELWDSIHAKALVRAVLDEVQP